MMKKKKSTGTPEAAAAASQKSETCAGARMRVSVERLVECCKRSNGIISVVATMLGVDWHTADSYIKKCPQAQEAFKSSREAICDVAESKLLLIVNNPNHPRHYDALVFLLTGGRSPEKKPAYLESLEPPSWVEQQILEEDGHSRNGKDLAAVNDIVIHYVANPGSTAQQNHDYFASSSSKVSSHYIVGLDGEIIQCLPLDEYSACTNERNKDTISIEVCHPDEDGKFNDETYASLIKLTAWLCDKADLDTGHVIRHHDVTGKICPKYYVENPEAWDQLLTDVKKAM